MQWVLSVSQAFLPNLFSSGGGFNVLHANMSYLVWGPSSEFLGRKGGPIADLIKLNHANF